MIKVEDCVDFVNDTELLEVDICGCVGGVGLLVCAVIAMIWTDVFVEFDVVVLENVVRGVAGVDLVLKTR